MRLIARAPIDLLGRAIRPGDAFEADEWDPADDRADIVDETDVAEAPADLAEAPAPRKRKGQ